MTLYEPFDEKAQRQLQEQHSCVFEVWDKEAGRMGQCGQPAYGFATTPKKALCRECFSVARARTTDTPTKFHAGHRGL